MWDSVMKSISYENYMVDIFSIYFFYYYGHTVNYKVFSFYH